MHPSPEIPHFYSMRNILRGGASVGCWEGENRKEGQELGNLIPKE